MPTTVAGFRMTEQARRVLEVLVLLSQLEQTDENYRFKDAADLISRGTVRVMAELYEEVLKSPVLRPLAEEMLKGIDVDAVFHNGK